MIQNGLKTAYQLRHDKLLVPAANGLDKLLRGYLSGKQHIDRISVRAKSPASFLEKAEKIEDGKLKYTDPLGEIQDQVGARVIVFYTSDVKPISKRVLRYFRHIEMSTKEPKSEAEFGYFGKHFVLSLPSDVIPSGITMAAAPPVFELQIRTLFQHAWSEAEHDIGYKPRRKLTKIEKRKFAFTAAQSWGADRIFQDLHDALTRGPRGAARRRT